MGVMSNRFDADNIVMTNVDLCSIWAKHSIWYCFCDSLLWHRIDADRRRKIDVDRFGMIPRTTPRQADSIIVAATITTRMASRVSDCTNRCRTRWVLSMGSCADAGGPFCKFSYSVLKGIDKYIPVDVYVPGCPPRPEAFIEGVFKLREKIKIEHVLRKEGKVLPKREPIIIADHAA